MDCWSVAVSSVQYSIQSATASLLVLARDRSLQAGSDPAAGVTVPASREAAMTFRTGTPSDGMQIKRLVVVSIKEDIHQLET